MMSNSSKLQPLPETSILFLHAAAGADLTNPRDLYSVLSHPRHLSFAESGNSHSAVAAPPLRPASMHKSLVDGAMSSGSLPNLLSLHDYDDAEPSSHQSLGKISADDSNRANLWSIKNSIVNDGINSVALPAADQDRVKVVTFAGHLLLPPIDNRAGYGGNNFPSTRLRVLSRNKRVAFPKATPLKSRSSHSKKRNEGQSWFTPVKKGNPNDSEVETTILKEQEIRLASTLLVNSVSNPPQLTSPQDPPLKVTRAATPTYEDYPEAYWELRSLTIQRPSDLKEDMNDRERYRLQQTSALRLRAFQYESMVGKMDSVRKWQQQLQDAGSSPRRQANTNIDLTNPNGGAERQGNTDDKELTTPVLSPPLVVESVSLTGCGLLNNKKVTSGNDSSAGKGAIHDATLLAAATRSPIPEMRNSSQREHSPISGKLTAKTAAALAAPERGLAVDTSTDARVKIMKASVVNLHMEAAKSPSHVPINSVMRAETTCNDRYKPCDQLVSSLEGETETEGHRALNSIISIGDELPSLNETQTSYLEVHTPSKPALALSAADTSDLEREGQCHTVSSSQSKTGSRKVLRKFNRLQVFGERSAGSQQQEDDKGDSRLATPQSSKTLYLPQCRPPSYRLDLKNYPPRGSQEGIPSGNAVPATANAISLFPTPPEPVTFQFQSGGVIVSRQGSQRAS